MNKLIRTFEEKLPLISVIMSVYNGEKYLRAALDSVLSQTFTNFEFIVINGGSTDNTGEILQQYTKQIKVIYQENAGIASAVNCGIEIARGKYIARMDADDISEKKRFDVQVDFLERNLDIGILGSTAKLIDSRNRSWGIQKVPVSDEEIRWKCLYKNPFLQSAVMIRRECLEFHHLKYRNEYLVEDYDLWVRLLAFTRGANLSVPLIMYRMHDSNASLSRRRKIHTDSKEISNQAIGTFLPEIEKQISRKEQELIQELIYASTKEYKKLYGTRIVAALNYLRLWEAFKKKSIYFQRKKRPS